MRTIVESIERVGDPASYAVTVTVDGVRRVFAFEIVLSKRETVHTRDRDFYVLFEFTDLAKRIAEFVAHLDPPIAARNRLTSLVHAREYARVLRGARPGLARGRPEPGTARTRGAS